MSEESNNLFRGLMSGTTSLAEWCQTLILRTWRSIMRSLQLLASAVLWWHYRDVWWRENSLSLSLSVNIITKTALYNFDPLKPHLYIVKLGFTGVNIIFFISAHKHRLWRGGSNEYHNLCFEKKYEKYQSFLSKIFHFWRWNFQYIWMGEFS